MTKYIYFGKMLPLLQGNIRDALKISFQNRMILGRINTSQSPYSSGRHPAHPKSRPSWELALG
jgi:hypothetical protein